MSARKAETIWLAAFAACLLGWFLTRSEWFIGLAFIAAAPFAWLALKRQWGAR